ncbi:hypothetical protein FB451DRAFT_1172947 [Mycena latifolia]|nr:hypothetical protein FB451DRAFT_1172947 [Mycena latifolia]
MTTDPAAQAGLPLVAVRPVISTQQIISGRSARLFNWGYAAQSMYKPNACKPIRKTRRHQIEFIQFDGFRGVQPLGSRTHPVDIGADASLTALDNDYNKGSSPRGGPENIRWKQGDKPLYPRRLSRLRLRPSVAVLVGYRDFHRAPGNGNKCVDGRMPRKRHRCLVESTGGTRSLIATECTIISAIDIRLLSYTVASQSHLYHLPLVIYPSPPPPSPAVQDCLNIGVDEELESDDQCRVSWDIIPSVLSISKPRLLQIYLAFLLPSSGGGIGLQVSRLQPTRQQTASIREARVSSMADRRLSLSTVFEHIVEMVVQSRALRRTSRLGCSGKGDYGGGLDLRGAKGHGREARIVEVS